MIKIKNNNRIQTILLIISIALLFILVIFPLISLFIKSFENSDGSFAGFSNFLKYFTTPNLLQSLTNTLFVSGVTTLISVPLAFIYAYALTRTGIRGKSFFQVYLHVASVCTNNDAGDWTYLLIGKSRTTDIYRC